MKKLIIILLFGLLLSSFAEAQTAAWSCDFNTTSCGFDLSSANGYLNVTSSTTMDWGASSYSWSNISAMVYCPTGGNGNKFQSITGSYKWLLDGTNWKNEPSYAISKGTMTLDSWVRMNFVHNHTANTSFVCIAGSCSSSGTWLVVPSTDSMTIETTYAGGKCAYDDMTIYILDSEVPANYSLTDHAGRLYNLTNSGAQYNSTGAYFFFPVVSNLSASVAVPASGNNFTVSLWMKDQGISTTYRGLFSRGWNAAGSYNLEVDTAQKLRTQIKNASSSTTMINSLTPVQSRWYHVVMIYNGTHQIQYVNGTLISSIASVFNGTFSTLLIGANHNGFSFNGSIDDVRIWNKSLSASQVVNVYSNQSVACSNLVAWYPFTAATLEVCTPQPRLVWEAHITGVTDYGNHSIEMVWANTTTGEYATNTTGLTFRIDDNIKPTFNVTNDSITNSSFQVLSNASEASNMSVKYGTTLNLGTASVNTTVSANLSVVVSGLLANTTYYYNVTRCNAGSNCNTTGPYTVTTLPTSFNYNLTDQGTFRYNLTIPSTSPVLVENCIGNKSCYNFTNNNNNMRLRIGNRTTFPDQNISGKAFSVSGWMLRANNVTNSESVLMSNQRFNTNCAGGYGEGCGGWQVQYGLNVLSFGIVVDNGTLATIPQNCNINYAVSIDESVPHLLTLTSTGAFGVSPLMYLDGVNIPNTSVSGNCGHWYNASMSGMSFGQPDRTAHLTIGENPQHSGTGFNGSIADVRFFNRTLSSLEVADMYNGGTVGTDALVFWYPFTVNLSTYDPCPSCGGSASLCPNILSLYYKANITLGRYDPKTKTYNQSTILPLNNSVCGWTYKLNNTDDSTKTFTFSTNYSNPSGNYTMFVNHSLFNTTSTKAILVPAGLVYYVNVTINLTRWPVLQSEPSANVSVVVS